MPNIEFPSDVTAEVVKEMTLKLRLWLSDQSLTPVSRAEARRYLAALWPPHEADYQAWLVEAQRRQERD